MICNSAKPMEWMAPVGVPVAAYRQVRGPLEREVRLWHGRCDSPDKLP